MRVKMSQKGSSNELEALRVMLPGDTVLQITPEAGLEHILLGPGLRWHGNVIHATRPGLLKKTAQNLYYVDNYQKRYIPHKGHFVVGIVIKKKGDNYIIDIGGSEYAVLSPMCFENVAVKGRKEMRPGELVFGQLLVADKDMEPEMVCLDVCSNTVGVGPLPEGGIMFTVPLHVTRMILNPKNTFLQKISRKVKYTLVAGANGRVWLLADDHKDVVAIMNCLKMLEVMTLQEAEENIYQYFDEFSS